MRFEVTAPLEGAGYCHCTRCQRRTGAAASANGVLAPGSLSILEGEALVSAYTPEGGSPKAFCTACGGALWSLGPDGQPRGIRLGALDGDPGVRPSFHQYVAYAAPWEPLPDDGLPRFPEARSA